MSEEWRAAIGFPEYQVSSLGRVRRVAPASGATVGKVLRQEITDGYAHVTFSVRNQQFIRRVHVLVCETFHGPRPSPVHEVAHNNGRSLENVASNVRWATEAENQRDRATHGTHSRGENNALAKLDDEAVREIRRLLRRGVTCTMIAKIYGVSRPCIGYVKNGITWTHVEN